MPKESCPVRVSTEQSLWGRVRRGELGSCDVDSQGKLLDTRNENVPVLLPRPLPYQIQERPPPLPPPRRPLERVHTNILSNEIRDLEKANAGLVQRNALLQNKTIVQERVIKALCNHYADSARRPL